MRLRASAILLVAVLLAGCQDPNSPRAKCERSQPPWKTIECRR